MFTMLLDETSGQRKVFVEYQIKKRIVVIVVKGLWEVLEDFLTKGWAVVGATVIENILEFFELLWILFDRSRIGFPLLQESSSPIKVFFGKILTKFFDPRLWRFVLPHQEHNPLNEGCHSHNAKHWTKSGTNSYTQR